MTLVNDKEPNMGLPYNLQIPGRFELQVNNEYIMFAKSVNPRPTKVRNVFILN